MKSLRTMIAAAVALLALSSPALAQLTFTVETTTTNGQTITPKLTWATSPAATSCTAAGPTDWTGNKAASGVVTLAAINTTRSYSLSCAWAGKTTIELTWKAPTTFKNGTALVPSADLGGYRIQYGSAATALTETFYLQDPLALKWTTPTLAPGQWFFQVRAYTATGLEGDLSTPVVSASTRTGDAQTRTLEVVVRFPSAPTEVTAN